MVDDVFPKVLKPFDQLKLYKQQRDECLKRPQDEMVISVGMTNGQIVEFLNARIAEILAEEAAAV